MKSKTKFRDILAFQFWVNGRAKLNWVTTVIAGYVWMNYQPNVGMDWERIGRVVN
jgi:hypothetical protein